MQLEVKDLKYVYGEGMPFETTALHGVSFSVAPGEFLAIIGHTGSGKSTLAEQIAGLIKPQGGSVFADGTDIQTAEGRALRKKIGMVFQYPEYQLFEEDVLTDVCFGPKNMGLSAEEQQSRAEAAIKLVGLDFERVKGKSPFSLSGGEKRRVAIAGVLAMEPEVLILDEPTAGLDPKGHDDILDMIDRIKEDKSLSIVLVSHNMDDVAAYADKVIVMNAGTVVMEGTPEYVYCERGSELKDIGLDLPAGPAFLERLREGGMDVDIRKLSFEETAGEIIRALKAKRGKKTEKNAEQQNS
jgi:energy-coupling factor transport system ATP-binding protein